MTTPSLDERATQRAGKVRIIFVHHSTGRILVRDGGVRNLITKLNEEAGTNYELWDHDYNAVGLTDAGGNKTGQSYDMPSDNTNPDGFDTLFNQPVHDPPDNALSHLLRYDVIVFKPCFPVCAIRSDAQLEQYKRHYISVRRAIERYPGRLFIAMTPPPLASLPIVSPFVPSSEQWTTPADARRARAFARWMVSPEFSAGVPNLKVFDLFDMLAGPEGAGRGANSLRAEYRSGKRGVIGLDSHPNPRAARVFAPAFVDFLHKSIEEFRAAAEKGSDVRAAAGLGGVEK